MASGQPTTIDFEAERQLAAPKRLPPFTVRTPCGPDLAYPVELLVAGEINPQVGLRVSWENMSDADEALLARRVVGKAVLDVA